MYPQQHYNRNIFQHLYETSGSQAVHYARRYETQLYQAKAMKNKIWFISECLKNKVCPKTYGRMEKRPWSGEAFSSFQEGYIKDQLQELKEKKEAAFAGVRRIQNTLQKTIRGEWYNQVGGQVNCRVNFDINRNMVNIKNKFERLFTNSVWIKFSSMDNIKNISSTLLTRDETAAPGLGLNFCVGTTNNINTEFNSKINYLNVEQHNDLAPFLRGVMIGSNENNLGDILPVRFSTALKRLKSYKDIRIMKADKGGSIVIMNSSEYREKMYRLLDDETTYAKIENPPTVQKLQNTFNQNVKKIISKLCNGKDTLCNKLFSSKLPELACIYGSPKIHKDGCPLRPIVSSMKSPTKNLAVWLARELGIYLGKFSESHVKHSVDFIEKVKNKNIKGHMVLYCCSAFSIAIA
ncbi:uncharacterized protein [Macrobrachium rosenbergii]|uniref:uncharacterized protein n=1 Tax=Macrobrachium rosenbergii TaxID=79674 RepID=UPI0034D3ED7E